MPTPGVESGNINDLVEGALTLKKSTESLDNEKLDLSNLLEKITSNKVKLNELKMEEPSEEIKIQISQLKIEKEMLLLELKEEVRRIENRIANDKKTCEEFHDDYNTEEPDEEFTELTEDLQEHKAEYSDEELESMSEQEKIEFQQDRAEVLEDIAQYVAEHDPELQKLSDEKRLQEAKEKAKVIYCEEMGYTNLAISTIQLDDAKILIENEFYEEGFAALQQIDQNSQPDLHKDRSQYRKERQAISDGFLEFLRNNPDLERTHPSLAQRIRYNNLLEQAVLAKQQREKTEGRKKYKKRKNDGETTEETYQEPTISFSEVTKKALAFISGNGGADIITNALSVGSVQSENNTITIPYDADITIKIDEQTGSMHIGNVPVDSLEPETFDAAYAEAVLQKEYDIHSVPHLPAVLTHVFGIQAKDGNRMTPEQGKAIVALFKVLGVKKESNAVVENTLRSLGIINDADEFVIETAQRLRIALKQSTNFDPQKIERLSISELQNML
jgi:hypothetical protein